MHSDTTEDEEYMTYKEWSMERGCADSCNPEQSNYCVEMGARTKVLYCTSCCTDSLCNVDNKAPQNSLFRMMLTTSLFIAASSHKLHL